MGVFVAYCEDDCCPRDAYPDELVGVTDEGLSLLAARSDCTFFNLCGKKAGFIGLAPAEGTDAGTNDENC